MKRICIVEDDKSISGELKELLDNSGYEAVALRILIMPVRGYLQLKQTLYFSI